MRRSFDYVTKELETDDGLPAKHRILFHCFNINGAYYRLKVLHAAIDKWCERNPDRPNGILFVHGSLNDLPRKILFDALDAPKRRKKVTSTISYAIYHVEHAIKDGYAWLDDPARWPAPKK